ncbi:alkaline phosphatase-like protein, partial [Lichtheimia hyalospora FSU 10163]
MHYSDFILGEDSGFDFVKSRIVDGGALAFTAKATAPTVTMPRIKALTTGTIPSFLDAILNIAESDTSSSLQHQDNWVHQFKMSENRTIHFFGDDTWIRLFPGIFTKHDGTTSFYVSDTVEVDLNVTRHVKPVLSEEDWDAVIFHYLGLDHVGHLGGPYSSLMLPKQKEMDKVVEDIYEIVSRQDAHRLSQNPDAKGTLIVVCGDHGMNEDGNHGGSSIGETSAALVLLSPRFESRPTIKHKQLFNFDKYNHNGAFGFPVIDQVDLVPTLSCLFGIPIPRNSLGKVVPSLFLKQSDPSLLLRALQLNAYQLGHLLANTQLEIIPYLHEEKDTDLLPHAVGKFYSQAVQSHKQFMETANMEYAQVSMDAYLKFIEIAQSVLTSTASDYKLFDMFAGALFVLISALGFQKWALQRWETTRLHTHRMPFSKAFAVFVIAAYIVSMFASSFIEEEHLTWYYCTATLFLLLAIESSWFLSMEKPFTKRLQLGSLCILQMILIRIGMAWGTRSLQTTLLETVTGGDHIRWHLLALSLLIFFVLGVTRIWKINIANNQGIVAVSSSAGYIQLLCKLGFALTLGLYALMVMIYKMRTDMSDNDDIPDIYKEWILMSPNFEFAAQLDIVSLGRLVYNYAATSVLVLTALVYVTERANVLELTGEDANEDDEPARHSLQASHYLDALLYAVTPVLILFTRTQNAVLFVLYAAQFHVWRRWQYAVLFSDDDDAKPKRQIPGWLLAILITCMTHLTFFMTGHSNSLAAVDLSNAYIGVDGYDTITIGVLTFCSNWSASLWWNVAGWILVIDNGTATHANNDEDRSVLQNRWYDYIITQSALFAIFITVLSISVTLLRYHLFVWTVFSP